MQITNQLAEKGVTLYTVGCEPSIIPYRDFFMSLAHLTGGQYVPLGSATLLAQVRFFSKCPYSVQRIVYRKYMYL